MSYEAQRLENIERNKRVLVELGLACLGDEKKPRTSKPKDPKPCAEVSRRSVRVKSLPLVEYTLDEDEDRPRKALKVFKCHSPRLPKGPNPSKATRPVDASVKYFQKLQLLRISCDQLRAAEYPFNVIDAYSDYLTRSMCDLEMDNSYRLSHFTTLSYALSAPKVACPECGLHFALRYDGDIRKHGC